MLKLKTNQEYLVPDEGGRGFISVIVRMIASHCSIVDINNVKVEGYYYYLSNENDMNSVVKIHGGEFGQSSLVLWDQITAMENMENSELADLCSTRNLKDVFFQRVEELTMLRLKQEEGQNWDIPFEAWIKDND